MKNVFESCEMMGVVDGSETIPPDDPTHIVKQWIWKKKDNLAKAMIMQCVKSDLVIKVAHIKHAKESWNVFASEFSQTGSGSIMLWFRRLTKQLPTSSDISTHVTSFQEAIHYLGNTEFKIPGYIAAAILLSTLPSDPQDPASWNNHITGVKINKSTTTLSSVINGILEEKQRLTEDDKTNAQKQEQALATLEQAACNCGKAYCCNHKREGHSTKECHSVGVPKEQQRSMKKKSRGKKKGK
jgi:gag-polypeptide of LTR copia-type